ncbi:MAG: type I-G CRISPR-associated RAMP protein Csb1/Cas7g [Acidimicrobiales bacterium]
MTSRELFDIQLRPAAGSRFQPTGFPDIGAAVFQRPIPSEDRWEDCLLVESAQSMANHLEATSWDSGTQKPVSAFDGMPYVRVVGTDGRFIASSRTEAHRLAGAFIKDATLDGTGMREIIKDRLGLRDDTPLAPREIAAAVFALDPMSLVHGVFFAEPAKVWPGQPKIPRAVTAFVEAHDVRQATSGGVKRDDVRHAVGDGDGGGAAEGYGFVPFHRTEWVARQIVMSVAIDLDQIASYGLPEAAEQLLIATARYEIRSLLEGTFRPRTACDLVPLNPAEIDRLVPPIADLANRIATLIPACGELFGGPIPLTVVWEKGSRRSTKTP